MDLNNAWAHEMRGNNIFLHKIKIYDIKMLHEIICSCMECGSEKCAITECHVIATVPLYVWHLVVNKPRAHCSIKFEQVMPILYFLKLAGPFWGPGGFGGPHALFAFVTTIIYMSSLWSVKYLSINETMQTNWGGRNMPPPCNARGKPLMIWCM
jgi:hypothetical protein